MQNCTSLNILRENMNNEGALRESMRHSSFPPLAVRVCNCTMTVSQTYCFEIPGIESILASIVHHVPEQTVNRNRTVYCFSWKKDEPPPRTVPVNLTYDLTYDVITS